MTERPIPRTDASMRLLTDVMTRTLDPGYAAAAQRRRERALPEGAGTRGRSPLAVVALVVLGTLLGTAWWQTQGTRPAGVSAREQLAAEITRQDAAASALARHNTALQEQIDTERARQLQRQSQGALASQVAVLGLVTGALSAVGPGIMLTLDDAKQAAPDVNGSDPRARQKADDGRVLDVDLQLVVNGLWASGAEAVAINDQRLTALSAVRSAGQAILVDYRPLRPPYRIWAIGDPATLQPRFSDGPGGQLVQYLKDNFGVRVNLATAARLVLPASAGLATRRAKAVVPGASSVPTSPPTEVPQTSRQQETP